MPMVEKQTTGNLLVEFVQAQFSGRTYTQTELEAGYKAMAADEEYELEAMEWCNGLMTADKSRLKNYFGVLNNDDMAKVAETIRIHLEI